MKPVREVVLDRLLAEQPAPNILSLVAGEPVVETLLKRHAVAVSGVVRDALDARRRLGILRYGNELHTKNGRSMLADGFQESLDAAVYYYGEYMTCEDRREQEDLLELVNIHLRAAQLAYAVAAGRETRRRAEMEERQREDQRAGRRTPKYTPHNTKE